MLLRLGVNAFINGIRKFLVQRLPTLRAPALPARAMLDNLDNTFNAEQPRCSLYDVT
jgi:hypothetical protein